jgi:hypothetical protein
LRPDRRGDYQGGDKGRPVQEMVHGFRSFVATHAKGTHTEWWGIGEVFD